jgi:uncharacterized protein YjbI with pentapeptide repeats
MLACEHSDRTGRLQMGSLGKLGVMKSDPKQRRGLCKLSPELIGRARDETATQAIRIGLTFLGTAAFCLLSLLTSDIALLGGSERIDVPLAGPVSFFGFILVGPAVLIALRVYLQIYVEHWDRLDRLAKYTSVIRREPTLILLHNPIARLFSGLIFYGLLPVTILLFAIKAAVFPAWGSVLLVVAIATINSHVMLPITGISWRSKIFRFSWRSKVLVIIVATIIYGVLIFRDGPFERPFELFRADLSGRWLVDVDLRWASLYYANLSGATLTRSNLRGAHLNSANLAGADLYYTKLNKADLFSANLSGANLGAANLNEAYLIDANLSGANLVSAKLCGAQLNNANLNKAILRYANLNRADLTAANLTGADLAGANLIDAKLNKANLRDALNLIPAQLESACGDSDTKLREGQLKACSAEEAPIVSPACTDH